MIEVRRITAEQSWPIRHAILRPGLPAESAHFTGDFSVGTLHFGAFLKGELVGVASVMRESPDGLKGIDARLRGMATLDRVRGMGCGRALVLAVQASVLDLGLKRVWCHARLKVEGFYLGLGFVRMRPDVYNLEGVGPHVQLEWLSSSKS